MLISNNNIDFKKVNKNLKNQLSKMGFEISNQSCLNLLARALGYENYNTYAAVIEKQENQTLRLKDIPLVNVEYSSNTPELTLIDNTYFMSKIIFIKQLLANAIQDEVDKSLFKINKNTILTDYDYLGDWGLNSTSTIEEIAKALHEELTEGILSYAEAGEEKQFNAINFLNKDGNDIYIQFNKELEPLYNMNIKSVADLFPFYSICAYSPTVEDLRRTKLNNYFIDDEISTLLEQTILTKVIEVSEDAIVLDCVDEKFKKHFPHRFRIDSDIDRRKIRAVL